MLDVTSTPLARHRESDRHGALSCVVWPVKTMWPLGNFVLQHWARQSWWLYDLWSKLRQEPRSCCRVESLCQGFTCKWTSEWMNTIFALLLFASFVPSWFFLSKCSAFDNFFSLSTTLHVVFPCYLSSFKVLEWFLPADPFLWKQTSEKIHQTELLYFVYLRDILLNILANQRKEDSLATPFFAKHTYLVELHLELNSGSSLHLYRSLSLFYTRCAPFRVWRCSQALLPPYCIAAHHFLSFRVPAKKSGGTNAIYGSACLALFTASLTKKWGVWSCALSKWQCVHNETSVTRSIWIQAKATPTSEVS